MGLNYYVGIDIGTTSVKSLAFSESGQLLSTNSVAYKMLHPQPGYSELNAKEILEAVIHSINQTVEFLEPAIPIFISFSSMMHSLISVDKTGEPLTNCIIWADNRASEIADQLALTQAGKIFYESTGVPVHAMTPLSKILWLKENDPGIFYSTYKFIGIKEYIFYQFCGEYIVDSSVASATGFLNINTLSWDKNILEYVDIQVSSLSIVVSPKHSIKFNAGNNKINDLQIPAATNLIVGGSDGPLANLGAGSVDGKSMTITIGTSSAARIVSDHPETDSKMHTFCYHLKDNLYVMGGAGNNGAVVLEWLKDKLLETTESFPELFSRANKIAAGSDGLLFIPYILGERAPIWNSNARGLFFGLTINHTKSHLIRACMEGVIYGIYSIAKILLEKKRITVIHATGGFAQSHLWVQMLADVCNIKILVSGNVESSALGAVMIAIEALGHEPFSIKDTLASYEPDLVSHAIYMKSFEKSGRIYESLKEEWISAQM